MDGGNKSLAHDIPRSSFRVISDWWKCFGGELAYGRRGPYCRLTSEPSRDLASATLGIGGHHFPRSPDDLGYS